LPTFHVLIDDGRGFQGVGVGEEIFMQPYNFVSRISQQRGGSQLLLLHGATGCGDTYYVRHSRNSSSVKAHYCKCASPESKVSCSDLIVLFTLPPPTKTRSKSF
jgi:hypothetical protein